jgi:hypothetical protein
MEGKDLLKLLDFARDLKEKGTKYEATAKEAIDHPQKGESRGMGKMAAEVGKDLEKLLRELNS